MTFSTLDSALLGPLFTTPEMRAVFADEARLAGYLRFETALARVQARFGLAPPALAQALEEIGPDRFDLVALGEATAVSGVPVIPFLKALRAQLPPALEPHLHKGATTQDVVDTAFALQMKDASRLVLGDVLAVLQGLAAMIHAHRRTPCVGRTYGQHAAPVTFGWKVAVWATGVAEAAQAVAVRRDALAVSLAGPAGILTGLGGAGPEVADGLAAELGLAAAPLASHTRRAGMAQTGAALAALSGALAKMAVDVAHLASTEVGEVAEPHVPGRGGSSAMPHKRNPVGATVIVAAHEAACGLVSPLFAAMAAAHERPAGAWHGEWHVLPLLFGLTAGALREAKGLAHGSIVDTARMRANLDMTKGLIFADDSAARLSSSLGADGAHRLVEQASARVRDGAPSLAAALADLGGQMDGDPFSLEPALAAAQPWIDRALAEIARVRDALME
jgi:3-carboxy-cis,cis-muconate cycloisomerase